MLSQMSVHIDAVLLQFPGGQPSALQERPGLVGENVEALARLGGGIQNGQGGAGSGGGQAAGVAVRQHAAVFGTKFGAMPADGSAHRLIVGVDPAGGQRSISVDGIAAAHFIECPKEIDRRRATRAQIVDHFAIGVDANSPGFLHADDDAIRRRDADGGAPRTRRVRIASQTSSTVRQSR